MRIDHYLEFYNNVLSDADYGCGCCGGSSDIAPEKQKETILEYIKELRDVADYWEGKLNEG